MTELQSVPCVTVTPNLVVPTPAQSDALAARGLIWEAEGLHCPACIEELLELAMRWMRDEAMVSRMGDASVGFDLGNGNRSRHN